MPIRYGMFVNSGQGFDVFMTMIDYSAVGNHELMFVEMVVCRNGKINLFLKLSLDEFLLLYDLFCDFFDVFFDDGGDDDGSHDDGDNDGGDGGGKTKNIRVRRYAFNFDKFCLN